MRAILELEGWQGAISCESAIMGYFAALREGQPDQAKKLLDAAAVRCDKSAWPYTIVKYIRGEIDKAMLMAAATDNDRMTAVRCSLGLECLQKNQQEAARSHFRWVKEHGNPSYTEYVISQCELDRLKGK